MRPLLKNTTYKPAYIVTALSESDLLSSKLAHTGNLFFGVSDYFYFYYISLLACHYMSKEDEGQNEIFLYLSHSGEIYIIAAASGKK